MSKLRTKYHSGTTSRNHRNAQKTFLLGRPKQLIICREVFATKVIIRDPPKQMEKANKITTLGLITFSSAEKNMALSIGHPFCRGYSITKG